jgi:site-specific DNA-adenine methylase
VATDRPNAHRVSPGRVSQANLLLFDQLLAQIDTWVPSGSRLLEVYAGAGAMALHLAPKLKSAVLLKAIRMLSCLFKKAQKQF